MYNLLSKTCFHFAKSGLVPEHVTHAICRRVDERDSTVTRRAISNGGPKSACKLIAEKALKRSQMMASWGPQLAIIRFGGDKPSELYF